jgi:hypothetical protein
MSNLPVRASALEALAEEARRVPVRYQKSLNAWLKDAERAQMRFATERGRSGGRASKKDALQKLIEEIVCAHPTLTESKLRAKLEARDRILPIVETTSEGVEFETGAGKSKTAAWSGLKHRLSRAKRTLKSRQPDREN